MSEELPPGAVPPPQASDEEVLSLVRATIEASREEARKVEDGAPSTELQQPGVTVDLTHKNIVRLPDEAIDFMKLEIERLAISHNRIISFPSRLAECSRLRYLNVRYNALKEVPRPVLQLESLEILDLSRNRIRVLPEEIGNLKSLKVLAISRNKIERLPLRLGDLTRLQLLKFDENPLVFPPPEAYALDPDITKPISANEQEAAITMKAKKFLKNFASSKSLREKFQADSDADTTQDTAETPRAPARGRAQSSRFPIKPSRSTTDLPASYVISPDDAPPMPRMPSFYQGRQENTPLVPQRSQNRPLATKPGNFSEMLRPDPLFSPPLERPGGSMMSANLAPVNTDMSFKSDYRTQTVITPRPAPNASRQNSTSSPFTVKPEKTSLLIGKGGTSISFEPDYADRDSREMVDAQELIQTTQTIETALEDITKRLDSLRPQIEKNGWHQLSAELNYLISAGIRMSEQFKAIKEPYLESPIIPRYDIERLGLCITNALEHVKPIAGLLCSKKPMFEYISVTTVRALLSNLQHCTRECCHAQYHIMNTYGAVEDATGLLAAKGKSAKLLKRRPAARNVAPLYTMSSQAPAVQEPAIQRIIADPGVAPSPMIMSRSNSSLNVAGSARFPSSPTEGALNDGEEERNLSPEEHFDRIMTLLKKLVNLCVETSPPGNLATLRDYFAGQKFIYSQDARHDGHKRIAEAYSVLSKAAGDVYIEMERLALLIPTIPDITYMSVEFVQFASAAMHLWSEVLVMNKTFTQQLGLRMGTAAAVKLQMREIHECAKSASKCIRSSPWGRRETPDPTTPLGAALGPAAAAAVPMKNIKFIDRYNNMNAGAFEARGRRVPNGP